jgi:hypothetical protein
MVKKANDVVFLVLDHVDTKFVGERRMSTEEEETDERYRAHVRTFVYACANVSGILKTYGGCRPL